MSEVKRLFLPGDEWLFYKIYSGPKTLEGILIKDIPILIQELLDRKIIDKFFYIRYSDPDYHIRLRFHLSDSLKINEAVSFINKSLSLYVEKRLVWKIVMDSYTREIERYGNKNIVDIETLFYFDSLLVLELLKNVEGSDEKRWLFSIRLIDTLLDKFDLSAEKKMEYYESLNKSYSQEFNFNKRLKVQLDDKYRKYSKAIMETMSSNESYIKNGIAQFFIHSLPVIEIIKLRERKAQLEVPIDNIIGSIIHMHLNRIFRTKQRLHEFVIYYFLSKFSKSFTARLKYNTTQ